MEHIEILIADIVTVINSEHKGMPPNEIISALAGVLATTARSMGADNADIFNLFVGLGWVYRPEEAADVPRFTAQSFAEQHTENRV